MIKTKQDPLRRLARSVKYQNIYDAVKEIPSLQLFDNIKNLSKIQLNFLYWLAVYNRLYCDLATGTCKYLTKEIIEHDFACECYLIWERKKKYKKDDKEDSSKKQIDRNSKVPSVVFTRGKK